MFEEVIKLKKLYVSPKIEYDEFRLVHNVCADLYERSAPGAEFYSVGVNGTSVVPEVTATEATKPNERG